MDSVVILNTTVQFSFLVGANPATPDMDRDGLRGQIAAMAQAINQVGWSPPFDSAFRIMKVVTFFVGAVPYGAASMTRPFTDQAAANFYWQAQEFANDYDPLTRASYFFHDCWHVVQFQRAGGPSANLDEEVAREVDAVAQQVSVAKALGCRPEVITFLQGYGADQAAIRTRIASGFQPGVPCTACRPVAQLA